MKTIINKLVILLLAVLAGVACTEHTEYNDTGFSAVEKLLYPSNGEAVDLIEQADANLYFEWSVSAVGTPSYTVIFMDADKKEVARYLADNNGQKAALKISHSQLNTVAAEAGIAPSQAGDLYWTVSAGLGNAELLSPAAPNKFTVARYASIPEPYHLYVTGEGSEFGADAANAKMMRELGNGQFEIYTKVTGAFNFINRNEAGNKRVFGVSDQGHLTEGAEAVAQGDGVYRMLVDFKRGTVTMQKITEVALLRAGTAYDGAALATLQYKANGVWAAENYTVPNSGDDRYRFRAIVDGAYQIWGSKDGTDAQDPGQIEGGSYFNVYVHTNVANLGTPPEYARVWKFHGPIKNLALTILVRMSPEVDSYHHSFDLGFDPQATPVSLTAPAADASIELNAQAGAKASFSWEKLSGDTPDVRLTTYSLVFFADAAKTKEVGRKSAGTAGSFDVTYSDLESIANSAGVAAEGTGDVYWTVESKLLASTVLADLRKLSITRMKGIPTVAYIVGAASEFGATYQALKALGGGKFEIFTKIKAGTYNFADGNTAEARKFVVTDGAISESTSSITATGENVYHILLDFGSGTATYQKIENMRLLTPNIKGTPAKHTQVPYQGNGIWYAVNAIPDTKTGWGDDRYFYWAEVDGTLTKFGANPGMGGDLFDRPAEDDARFRVFWPIANVDSDDAGAFKLLHAYRDNTTKRVNIKLNMSPAVEHYYNYIEYLD